MPTTGYSFAARTIHWTMAILILSTIPVGFLMVQSGLERTLQNALFIYHKNLGVLLLLLVVLRIGYRLWNPPPPLPTDLPRWQARAAGFSHLGLYVLMVVMPVAGYVRVRAGDFPIETLDAMGVPALVPPSDAVADVAKLVHEYAAYALTALVIVHISAALYHAAIRRDGVFSRMWPAGRRQSR
ncbi:cytochrome b [Roseovarius sp. D0-M9]|uniref:cytochrome b n=1 Tax=Roseovarius sp. D0-M9 TaxID=3127117 RepID=UPI00300F9213